MDVVVIHPPNSPLSNPSSNSMTLVSNDPNWWPLINASRVASYLTVASSAGLIFDCALTFTREVELIWMKQWSLMTILYFSARYVGILYAVIAILSEVQTISVTDIGCLVLYGAMKWTNVVVTAILGAIMIARLHAMYQGSRQVLIFLTAVFLVVNITDVVVAAITMGRVSAEEVVLSGTFQCKINGEGDVLLLDSIAWIVPTLWQVLALCLALWVVVEHFRELRRHSAEGLIGDCFKVLMKTHMVYFGSSVAVSCFELSYSSPTMSVDPRSLETHVYFGVLQIFLVLQMFALGPRLILCVREYHAELVANSDAGTAMTTLAFQEVNMSTSSSI